MYGRSRINHVIPVGIPHVSPTAKVLQTLYSRREFAGRNRAGISPTRRERTRRGFACFACWLRRFVLATTNAAVAAARLGPPDPLHRTPYTFGLPPRPAPPPPFYPSVVPFHARLVDDSRGRAFSSLISLFGPPSVPFHFFFVSAPGMHLRAWTLAIFGCYRSIVSSGNIETNIFI